MSGKPSRDKGKRYEQHLARAYRAKGFEVERNSQQAHGQSAVTMPDPKGDILGLPAVHVQAKNHDRLNIHAALAQAEAEAPTGFIPAVHFHRPNTSYDYVALPLEDFIDLLVDAYGVKPA